jgi:hypothetical protein
MPTEFFDAADELGTVRVFRQEFNLDDAIGSQACSFAAVTCVWRMSFISGVHPSYRLALKIASKH